MRPEEYILGAIPSPKDSRDYNIAMFTPVKASFPKEFKLEFTEKIKDQGSVGSCVAQSLAYTREIVEERQSGIFKEFSPGYIYANREGTLSWIFETEGMVPREALQALKEYGAVLQEDFPYHDTYKNLKPYFEAQKKELHKKAADYKITVYARVYTVEEVKTALMELGPVTVMYPIYSSFYQTSKTKPVVPIPNTEKEQFKGYHQMTIVGWKKDNTFIVLNSWGESWADKGKCYIPFSYPVEEYWTITDLEFPHWADKYHYFLNQNGVKIHDKRFNDYITRGEVIALLARMMGFKE